MNTNSVSAEQRLKDLDITLAAGPTREHLGSLDKVTRVVRLASLPLGAPVELELIFEVTT
jgi:hypothetical protein